MIPVDNDDMILEGLREGRGSAFRFIYDHHYALLCYIATNYVRDAFVAETIVGDMIFHLWEVRATLDIRTSLRSYLMRGVRNRCINYLQSEHVRREVSAAYLLEDDMLNGIVGDDHDQPLGRLIAKELENRIFEAVDRLPEECRRVFEKSRFEGKTYEEIAADLGISVNTVKYHVRRALAQLHDDLSAYLPVGVIMLILEFGQFMRR